MCPLQPSITQRRRSGIRVYYSYTAVFAEKSWYLSAAAACLMLSPFGRYVRQANVGEHSVIESLVKMGQSYRCL